MVLLPVAGECCSLDILQNGVAVLGKTPAADHIQTWLSMLERNIPVSANSFQAVHQLLHGLSVSTLVNELKGVVQQLLSQGSTQGSTQLQLSLIHI